MKELIQKLKDADGPSRELDAHIHLIGTDKPTERPGFRNVERVALGAKIITRWRSRNGIGESELRAFPEYTASIDAALALTGEVLPGAFSGMKILERALEICTDYDEYGWGVEKLPHAILIATLTAIETENTNDKHGNQVEPDTLKTEQEAG